MASPVWLLKWDTALSAGIPELDEDHKLFISLTNELSSAIAGRRDIGEINHRVRQLLSHAEHHRIHEAAILARYHYPSADAHAKTEAETISHARNILANLQHNAPEYQQIGAVLKVKETLIEHFLYEDKKYLDYYRSTSGDSPANRM